MLLRERLESLRLLLAKAKDRPSWIAAQATGIAPIVEAVERLLSELVNELEKRNEVKP